MKNDTTTTLLNFVLAVLVILCVVFALLSIWKTRDLQQLQARVLLEQQQFQIANAKAQALLQDAMNYNATAKSPEMAQIIQSVQNPAPTINK